VQQSEEVRSGNSKSGHEDVVTQEEGDLMEGVHGSQEAETQYSEFFYDDTLNRTIDSSINSFIDQSINCSIDSSRRRYQGGALAA